MKLANVYKWFVRLLLLLIGGLYFLGLSQGKTLQDIISFAIPCLNVLGMWFFTESLPADSPLKILAVLNAFFFGLVWLA